MLFAVFLILSSGIWQVDGMPLCVDLLMEDVCKAYLHWGNCYLPTAQEMCRKTCGVCGVNWTPWVTWGQCSEKCGGERSRTRTCNGRPSDCIGEDFETEDCDCTTGDPDTGAGTGEVETGETDIKVVKPDYELACNSTHFGCLDVFDTCISIDLVCDGYDDCINGFDEEFQNCKGGRNGNLTFQIKSDLKQVCMEVITDDPAGPKNGIRAYRRCPSELNPQRSRFLWKWWQSFHLLNLETGRCLEAQNPSTTTIPELTTRPCDTGREHQKFVCDDYGTKQLLVRLRKITDKTVNRYISLGEDMTGWPPVLVTNYTGNQMLWHRGPEEPPKTLCGAFQVYWSEWGEWGECSTTCIGGFKSHRRFCVNGKEGIAPCNGETSETLPCNGNVPCKKYGAASPNSDCRKSWFTLENPRKGIEDVSVDPACYLLVTNRKLNHSAAKHDCKQKRSFLGAIKEETSNTFFVNTIASKNFTGNIYIGIEEDFYFPPVQGHHLRYDLDSTPVGLFKPWKVDCVLGPGYNYMGKISETESGSTCQAWNSISPHKVEYTPVGDIEHNYCRNPNLDPKGPWCYTTDPLIEKNYCDIPQCLAMVEATKLSEVSEFQIAQMCQERDGRKNTIAYLFTTAINAPKILKRTGCIDLPKSKDWSSVDNSQRFVWDSSRTKILSPNPLLCMEATDRAPDSPVYLVECKSERVTQRWFTAGNLIYLDYNHLEMDLHLDMSVDNTAVVITTLDLSTWIITRARGHKVDWGRNRRSSSDDSIYIYDEKLKLCLGTNITEWQYDDTAPAPYLAVAPKLKPCEISPTMKWRKYLGSVNVFYHPQSGLCLKADSTVEGSKFVMTVCDTEPAYMMKCQDLHFVTLSTDDDLYMTASGEDIVLSAKTVNTTKWSIWKAKYRKICGEKDPDPTNAVGSMFSIRNKHLKKCLHVDAQGSLHGELCQAFGSSKDEVWRFTEVSSMLMHFPTRTCLSAGSSFGGALVSARDCDMQNVKQHWAFFPRNEHFLNKEYDVTYYSLHLVMNQNFVLTMNTLNSIPQLRDDTTRTWMVLNRYGDETSLEGAKECVAKSKKSTYFYRGSSHVTVSGKVCEPWTDRDKKVHHELVDNLCRNPGDESKFPWCWIKNKKRQFVKEECDLATCPTVKVAADQDGKWLAVSGNEELNYLCQAEPECYRGLGEEYIGSWNLTSTGVCVKWSDHIMKGVADHNYCRNPTKSPGGPWCYLSVAKSIKEECGIPECHETCPNIPEDLFHSETVQHDFSATVHGLESASTAVTQCHRGYWVSRDVRTHDTVCVDSEWNPEPASCRVVTCLKISVVVPGARLISSKNILYEQMAVYACEPKLIAGPSKVTIDFRCNEVGKWKKLPNQEDRCSPACDKGWTSFRTQCYKAFPEKRSFDSALEQCQALNGTLADIDDVLEFDFLKDLVIESDGAVHGQQTLYWLGIRHIPEDPPPKHPMWRDYRSINYLDDVRKKRGAKYLPFLRSYFIIMHYMNSRHTDEFEDILPYSLRCMFIEPKYLFAASRGCSDYPRRTIEWMWISPHHLYNIATKKCLTGMKKNGLLKTDIENSATAEECDVNNRNQFVGCRRHGEFSTLKLLFQKDSYFVDTVEEPWDKIQMGGGYYAGNYARWILNETDYDICHYSVTIKGNAFLVWEGTVARGDSYTFDEAIAKCEEFGAKLATKKQLEEKMNEDDISSCSCAWADGNNAYSVMRTFDPVCKMSAPAGGVKQCVPTPTKADAWCFRGSDRKAIEIPWAAALWLNDTESEGLQERSEDDPTKYICRKDSRWYCDKPPKILHATIKENIYSSYSYLGFSAYECDPGYWFDRGIFVQSLSCNYHLMWDPHPETLYCSILECLPPPQIANADLTEVTGLLYQETASYRCIEGFWFFRFQFDIQVKCSSNALWDPSPGSLKCFPVECDPPPKVLNSRFDAYAYEFPYNATYTCDEGFWFEPGVVTAAVTCGIDGAWKPDPKKLMCFEIVCPPPEYILNSKWHHIDRKNSNVSCEKGFKLISRNADYPDPKGVISIKCTNDGKWIPDPDDFQCAAVRCPRPPNVTFTHHDWNPRVKDYTYKSWVTYHCDLGYKIYRKLSLVTLPEGWCIGSTENTNLFAHSKHCISNTAAFFQRSWLDGLTSNFRVFIPQIAQTKNTMCLSVEELPSSAVSVRPFLLARCDRQDPRQRFRCNTDGVSDFFLALADRPYYFSLEKDTGRLVTTQNIHSAVELVPFTDENTDDDHLNFCQFDEHEAFKQRVQCSDAGDWIPRPSIFYIPKIKCKKPPRVNGATVKMLSSTADGGYTYGFAAKYTCIRGYEYLLKRNTFISRCSGKGTWVPDPLDFPCKGVICPPYELPFNARVVRGNIDNLVYRSTLLITCPLGWYFEPGLDVIQAKCDENRKWEVSHEVEGCKPVTCDPVPRIHNASITTSGFNAFNTVARYVCDQGFWFDTSVVWRDTYCAQTGLWDPQPSTWKCQTIVCEDPGVIPRTKRFEEDRDTEEFVYGSVVMYKCDEGHWFASRVRKAAVTCRDDGHWHPSPGSIYCQEKTCEMPHPLPHNTFVVGGDLSYGSSINIVCERGYRIGQQSLRSPNSTKITCTKDQAWEPDVSQIECLPLLCRYPPAVPYASIVSSSITYNSHVEYVCVTGYWFQVGIHSRVSKCGADTKWYPDPKNYECQMVSCGHPGSFYNAKPVQTPGGRNYAASATLTCMDGYWLDGLWVASIRFSCMEDGLWEPPPEDSFCVAISCPEPDDVEHSTKTFLGSENQMTMDIETNEMFYYFETQMKYVCDAGLQLGRQTFAIVLTCSKDGSWDTSASDLRCQPITCDPPGAIAHGFVSKNTATSDDQYVLGSELVYRCDHGYWIKEHTYDIKTTCQVNGLWDVDLQYLACLRVVCPPITDLDNGHVVVSGDSFTHTARYSCDKGYEPTSKSEPWICSETGSWFSSKPRLSCAQINCESNCPELAHAVLSFASRPVAPGTTCEYDCNEGYFFSAGVTERVVTCGEDGEWQNVAPCLSFAGQECEFPEAIPFSYFESNKSQALTLQCYPGYYIKRDGREVNGVTMQCTPTGWIPDDLVCSEVKCPYPEIRGPHHVVGNSARDSLYKFAQTATLRCRDGYVVRQRADGHPTKYDREVDVICRDFGKWFPLLSTLECTVVNCGFPLEIENTDLTFNATTLFGEAKYTCEQNTSFSLNTITLKSYCSIDGAWSPDPRQMQCQYRKCAIPIPPPYASMIVMSSERHETSGFKLLQKIKITCNLGYQIADKPDFHLSEELTCNQLGQWSPNPTEILCRKVTCPMGNVTLLVENDKQLAESYDYGGTVTFVCPPGQWFAPDNVFKQTVQCWFDTTWKSPFDEIECVDVGCDYPPLVEHSDVTGEGLTVGSKWKYQCDEGYTMGSRVSTKQTTCQPNGRWKPLPNSNKFICKLSPCPTPPILPNTVNGSLLAVWEGKVDTEYLEGSSFMYLCLSGFWVSDGLEKRTSVNLTCVFGKWQPDPLLTVKCTMVVCDEVIPVEGARTEGLHHVFGSAVTYTCARGQHFAMQQRRSLECVCMADGSWQPDPKTLACTDVYCKDIELENAHKQPHTLAMGSTAVYSCPPTMWLGVNSTELATTCNEDGRWEPSLEGKKCAVVDCGEPPIANLLLQHDNFTYTRQAELACLGGYILTPETSAPPVLMCDITGLWYPSPYMYHCQIVECPEPQGVSHATLTGETVFNSTLTVQCDPGYFVRRGQNKVEVECLHDGSWSEEPTRIVCAPFHCLAPRDVSNAKLQASLMVPAYESTVRYECLYGYWIGESVYSRTTRCSEDGMWRPIVNYTCFKTQCSYPPTHEHGVFSSQDAKKELYVVDERLHFACEPSYWLAGQYNVSEWAFTGVTQVPLKCDVTGHWLPHPDSFACRGLSEGPVPIGYARGLESKHVLSSGWLKNEILLKEEFFQHPYHQTVVIGPRKWLGGPLPKSSVAIGDNDTLLGGARFLWDGDVTTSWNPKRFDDRKYSFAVYLGGTYEIESFEIHTGSGRRDNVVEIEVLFSPDGKSFDRRLHVTLGSAQGRVSGRVTSQSVPAEQGYKWRVDGFSETAKFVQVKVLAVADILFPPNVREVRFLATPVEWRVVYPLDIVTLPVTLGALVICLLFLVYLSGVRDTLDKQTLLLDTVDYGPADVTGESGEEEKRSIEGVGGSERSGSEFPENEAEWHVIKLTSKALGKFKYLICRLIGETSCSPIMLLHPKQSSFPLKSDSVVLLAPARHGTLRKLCLGYIDPELNESCFLSVKMARVKESQPLGDNVQWKFIRNSAVLDTNKVNLLSLVDKEEAGDQLRAYDDVTFFFEIRRLFINFFFRHLLITIFMKDFLSRTSRRDRTLAFAVGSLSSLAAAMFLSNHEAILRLLTGPGLGSAAALCGLPLTLLFGWLFAHWPVYRLDPEREPLLAASVVEVMEGRSRPSFLEAGDSRSDFSLRSKRLIRSIRSLASFEGGDVAEALSSADLLQQQRGPDLELGRLLDSFRLMDVDCGEGAFSLRQFLSNTNTQDSCLLPAHYRMICDREDAVSLSSRDLDDAHVLRVSRLPRRTRSCTALLQYRPPWFSSLPDIRWVDDELSCASLWSRQVVRNAWHEVHTSVRRPVADLLARQSTDDGPPLPPVMWRDPTYRRIPSSIFLEGINRRPPRFRTDFLSSRKLEDKAFLKGQSSTASRRGRLESIWKFNFGDKKDSSVRMSLDTTSRDTASLGPATLGTLSLGTNARDTASLGAATRDSFSLKSRKSVRTLDTEGSELHETKATQYSIQGETDQEDDVTVTSTKPAEQSPEVGADDVDSATTVKKESDDKIGDMTPDDAPSFFTSGMKMKHYQLWEHPESPDRHKKVPVPAKSRQVPQRRWFGLPIPSAGAKHEKLRAKDSQHSSFMDCTLDGSHLLAQPSSQVVSKTSDVGLTQAKPRIDDVVVATPFSELHWMPPARRVASPFAFVAAIGFAALSLYFGLTTINRSAEIATCCVSSLLCYAAAILLLESLLRRWLVDAGDRIVLSRLFAPEAAKNNESDAGSVGSAAKSVGSVASGPDADSVTL